jgi:hypothetical protein
MMGPDYTHWHGTYEIAQHFYIKMVPELEHLIEQGEASKDAAKQKAAKALQAKLDEVLNSQNHKWYLNKLDPNEAKKRKEAAAAFKARYAK